jgi:biotin carboxylase
VTAAPGIAARTVLFLGAGRHQRRAIRSVRELGARVLAVDRSPAAPGFADADETEPIDFANVDAVIESARRHRVDGVMTTAADSAVPVVAAVAEALGLPGIGSETAHLMTHKVAMRRRLADAGIPQPRFAAVRTVHEAHAAAATVAFPAVLKPADSSGQRGIFLLDGVGDLEAHLHAALAESPSQEAIVESFHDGLEVNALLVARRGEPSVVTLSDRRRPPGLGFGVAVHHVYPSTLFGDALDAVTDVAVASVKALGLRDGVAYPQLLVCDDGLVRVVEVAARIPGGQMSELALHAVGVDLVHVALLQALGEEVPDELVRPRFQQPLAVHFLTASPGPLPTGTVERVRGLERVLEAPGVVDAAVYLAEGDVIRPVQRDGDRRGWVIARGETNIQAVALAEAAAGLLEVEVT